MGACHLLCLLRFPPACLDVAGMLTQERIPAFLDKWIQSHIAAGTNLTTGSKPIMFEEFGKKLEPAQQTEFMIEQLRDPVYTSTYASVESAINANQPIAGSMFWKMSIPVFNRQDPRGEFTVQHSLSGMSCTPLLLRCWCAVSTRGVAVEHRRQHRWPFAHYRAVSRDTHVMRCADCVLPSALLLCVSCRSLWCVRV
jgi:hypothetical protein